jgi:hypothetical protein
MVKVLKKLEIEGIFLDTIKAIDDQGQTQQGD